MGRKTPAKATNFRPAPDIEWDISSHTSKIIRVRTSRVPSPHCAYSLAAAAATSDSSAFFSSAGSGEAFLEGLAFLSPSGEVRLLLFLPLAAAPSSSSPFLDSSASAVGSVEALASAGSAEVSSAKREKRIRSSECCAVLY